MVFSIVHSIVALRFSVFAGAPGFGTPLHLQAVLIQLKVLLLSLFECCLIIQHTSTQYFCG